MVDMYTKMGCDFSACETAEDKLAAIEEFDDTREAEAQAAAKAAAEQEASLAERQTAALEAIADGQTTENAAALDALLNGEG
jgi:RPA family protein